MTTNTQTEAQPITAQLTIVSTYDWEIQGQKPVPNYFPASQAVNAHYETGWGTWVYSFGYHMSPCKNGCLVSFEEIKYVLRSICEDPALVGFSAHLHLEYPLGTTYPSKKLLENYSYVEHNKKRSINLKVGFTLNKTVGERNETGEQRVLNFLDNQLNKIVVPANPISFEDMTTEEQCAWDAYHIFNNRKVSNWKEGIARFTC